MSSRPGSELEIEAIDLHLKFVGDLNTELWISLHEQERQVTSDVWDGLVNREMFPGIRGCIGIELRTLGFHGRRATL